MEVIKYSLATKHVQKNIQNSIELIKGSCSSGKPIFKVFFPL